MSHKMASPPPEIFALIGGGLRIYRLIDVRRNCEVSHEFIEIPLESTTFITHRDETVTYPLIQNFTMWNSKATKIITVDWYYYGYTLQINKTFIPCISGSLFGKILKIDKVAEIKIPNDDPLEIQRKLFRKMYKIIKTSFAQEKSDFASPHIIALVLDKAYGEICPVTHETITETNACITSCGHVFTYEGILAALSVKEQCPLCRKRCYLLL